MKKYLLIIMIVPFLLSCSNSENWNMIMTCKTSGSYANDYLALSSSNSHIYIELHIPNDFIAENTSTNELLFIDGEWVLDEFLYTDEFSNEVNQICGPRFPREFIPATNTHYSLHLPNKTSKLISRKVAECFSEYDSYTFQTNLNKLSFAELKNLAIKVNDGAFFTTLTCESITNTEVIVYPSFLYEKYDNSLFELLMTLEDLFKKQNDDDLSKAMSVFWSCGISATNRQIHFSKIRRGKVIFPENLKEID